MSIFKKLTGSASKDASETIDIDVKSERMVGKEPIAARLVFMTGQKYVVICKDGIEARTAKREGGEVSVNATRAEFDKLYFSVLQQNMVLGVGGPNSSWARKGVNKGAILTQVNGVSVPTNLFAQELIAEQFALTSGEMLMSCWDVPLDYEIDAAIRFIPALTTILLTQVFHHCVAVTCEEKKEVLYIEHFFLQQPALLELKNSWEKQKLAPGTKCIIMHDILGVSLMEHEDGEVESDDEVDIFSSTIVEILKVDKKKEQAIVVICAEPDDKWVVKLRSREGRPALRAIDSDKLVIHYPASEDEEDFDGGGETKLGFTFDADELAAYAAKEGITVEEGAAKVKSLAKGKKSAKAKAKGGVKKRARPKGKGKAKAKKSTDDSDDEAPGAITPPPGEGESAGVAVKKRSKAKSKKVLRSATTAAGLGAVMSDDDESADSGDENPDGAVKKAKSKKKPKKKGLAKSKTVAELSD